MNSNDYRKIDRKNVRTSWTSTISDGLAAVRIDNVTQQQVVVYYHVRGGSRGIGRQRVVVISDDGIETYLDYIV